MINRQALLLKCVELHLDTINIEPIQLPGLVIEKSWDEGNEFTESIKYLIDHPPREEDFSHYSDKDAMEDGASLYLIGLLHLYRDHLEDFCMEAARNPDRRKVLLWALGSDIRIGSNLDFWMNLTETILDHQPAANEAPELHTAVSNFKNQRGLEMMQKFLAKGIADDNFTRFLRNDIAGLSKELQNDLPDKFGP